MTQAIEIPIPQNEPLFSQRIPLDGTEYLFKFDWNDRAQRWFFSIFTLDEQPLAIGIKIVSNWPLLRCYKDPRLPQGLLMAVELTGVGFSPTFNQLGTDVRMFYYSLA